MENAPELAFGLAWFYDAFLDLSGDRTMGMGPGPIPWTSIVAYARYHGLDEEETSDLLYHVRRMDREYLRYHQERLRRK